MARSIFGAFRYRLQHAAGGEGEGDAPNPAEINAEGNQRRLDRISQIGRTADAQRAHQMRDANGERDGGEFAGGEFKDDPVAQEAEARRQEELDRQADEEAREEEEARRLQAEGAGADHEKKDPDEEEEPPAEADEKVVGGVRYYKTIVAGQERWLTLAQLREGVAASANVDETLRRAQDALRSAAQAETSPKPSPAEELTDQDLESIVISASTGDEEAVKKLVSVIRHRPSGPTAQDVSRQVSQQIATQREVDRSEKANEDVLGNQVLAPEFRRRLSELGRANPKMKIFDAYAEVGKAMRKDFAAMLKKPGDPPEKPSKIERKRTIVNPPQAAGRRPPGEDPDREVPLSEQIDAIARSRGQQRAHRVRRS